MAMDRTTRSSHLRTRSSFTRKGFTSYKSLAGLRRKPSLSRSRKDGKRINGFQLRTRSDRSIDQNRSTNHGEHRINGDKRRKAINPSQTEAVRSSGRNVSNVTRSASKASTSVSKKEVSTIVTKKPVPTNVSKSASKTVPKPVTVKIEPLPSNGEQQRPMESSPQSVVSILKNSPTMSSDQKLRSKKCVRICVPIKEERLSIDSNDKEESHVSNDVSTDGNGSRQDGGSINATIVSNPVRDRRKTRALSNLGLVRVVSKVTSSSSSSSSASSSSMASSTSLDGIKEEESIKRTIRSLESSATETTYQSIKSEVTFGSSEPGPSSGSSSTSSNCSKNGGHRVSRKVTSDRVYKIQKIIKSQRRSNGLRYFLVKWKNWSSKFNSWEPETNFSPDLLRSLGYKPTVNVNGIKNGVSGLNGKNGLKVATATDMASVQLDLLSKVKTSSIDTINTNRKIDLRTSSPKTNGQRSPVRITDPLKNETMDGKNGFCSNVPKATCSNVPKGTIPKANVSKVVSEVPNSESLDNLVPKRILTIEPTRQGLVVLMKWKNYPLLSWLDYEWVKAKYPNLCFEYHESMIRFRSRPIVDIDTDDD